MTQREKGYAQWRHAYQYPNVTKANMGYYFPDEDTSRLTMAQVIKGLW